MTIMCQVRLSSRSVYPSASRRLQTTGQRLQRGRLLQQRMVDHVAERVQDRARHAPWAVAREDEVEVDGHPVAGLAVLGETDGARRPRGPDADVDQPVDEPDEPAGLGARRGDGVEERL